MEAGGLKLKVILHHKLSEKPTQDNIGEARRGYTFNKTLPQQDQKKKNSSQSVPRCLQKRQTENQAKFSLQMYWYYFLHIC